MVRLVISLLTFLCKVVRALGLSVGNYQATLTIEGFKGVMQFDENESINTDMKYAADARNFDTRDGNLLPLAGAVETTPRLSNSAAGNVGVFSLGRKVSRWQLGPKVLSVGGEIGQSENIRFVQTLFTPGNEVSVSYPPLGSLDSPAPFQHSYVQYEYQDGQDYYDVLLVTVAGDDLRGIRVLRSGDGDFGMITVTTPYHFSVIARYGERIWGTGAAEAPDTICYSRAYNPLDWTQDTQIPEDGGGEIRQPTFDGEGFTALVPFGNSLLAFKEHSLWRITGMSPDEFVFQQQYGVGTIYPNTICVYQEAVYFLTDRGICRFDGAAVRSFQPYAMREVWRDHLNKNTDRHLPVATVWHDRYILSFPTSAEDTHNTDAIIYDFAEGTWERVGAVLAAMAYAVLDDDLILLQPIDEITTKVAHWYGSIEETPTASMPDVTDFRGFDWLTPWSDMGAKDILKNEFKLRFWIQTRMASGDRLKLAVTVETERGSKTREIIFDRDVDEEIKMRFHLSGRKVRMRFKLTDQEGNEQITSWCKIMGGMQLNADTSPD